ncbi:MAG: helix-turn-helix domain-containing protein [Gemmatimonadota bacterium]
MTGGNKSAAARILGCSRPTVGRKVDLYDLENENAEGGDGGRADA